jgi:hypothetical protein
VCTRRTSTDHFDSTRPDRDPPSSSDTPSAPQFGSVCECKSGPDNRTNVLEPDGRARIYRIEPALLEGLKRAFDLADARSDLLRRPARSNI